MYDLLHRSGNYFKLSRKRVENYFCLRISVHTFLIFIKSLLLACLNWQVGLSLFFHLYIHPENLFYNNNQWEQLSVYTCIMYIYTGSQGSKPQNCSSHPRARVADMGALSVEKKSGALDYNSKILIVHGSG